MTTAPEAASKKRRGGKRAAATDGATTDAPMALPETRSRRRPGVIAIGVALVIVGALGSWFYISNARHTEAVFVTSTDITRGEKIEQTDLATIELAASQKTDAIPADQASEILGKTATVDLPAGSLLTPGAFSNRIEVADDQSIVGFTLSGTQMPSTPLSAGDSIRIVETPVAQGDPPAETPKTFPATVFTVNQNLDKGVWVVNVIVPKSDAAALAARAATGRVALILDGGGE